MPFCLSSSQLPCFLVLWKISSAKYYIPLCFVCCYLELILQFKLLSVSFCCWLELIRLQFCWVFFFWAFVFTLFSCTQENEYTKFLIPLSFVCCSLKFHLYFKLLSAFFFLLLIRVLLAISMSLFLFCCLCNTHNYWFENFSIEAYFRRSKADCSGI